MAEDAVSRGCISCSFVAIFLRMTWLFADLVVSQDDDVWCPQPVGGAKEGLQGGSIVIRVCFHLL